MIRVNKRWAGPPVNLSKAQCLRKATNFDGHNVINLLRNYVSRYVNYYDVRVSQAITLILNYKLK